MVPLVGHKKQPRELVLEGCSGCDLFREVLEKKLLILSQRTCF